MKNINNNFLVSLIKSLLYILVDQHISLKILRITLMMTRDYKKCYNASQLIYREYYHNKIYSLVKLFIPRLLI